MTEGEIHAINSEIGQLRAEIKRLQQENALQLLHIDKLTEGRQEELKHAESAERKRCAEIEKAIQDHLEAFARLNNNDNRSQDDILNANIQQTYRNLRAAIERGE